MLSCKDVTHKSSDYIDNKLPLISRWQMRLHIFMCVRCAEYIRQMRATVASIGLLKDRNEPAQAVIDETVSNLLEISKKRS